MAAVSIYSEGHAKGPQVKVNDVRYRVFKPSVRNSILGSYSTPDSKRRLRWGLLLTKVVTNVPETPGGGTALGMSMNGC